MTQNEAVLYTSTAEMIAALESTRGSKPNQFGHEESMLLAEVYRQVTFLTANPQILTDTYVAALYNLAHKDTEGLGWAVKNIIQADSVIGLLIIERMSPATATQIFEDYISKKDRSGIEQSKYLSRICLQSANCAHALFNPLHARATDPKLTDEERIAAYEILDYGKDHFKADANKKIKLEALTFHMLYHNPVYQAQLVRKIRYLNGDEKLLGAAFDYCLKYGQADNDLARSYEHALTVERLCTKHPSLLTNSRLQTVFDYADSIFKKCPVDYKFDVHDPASDIIRFMGYVIESALNDCPNLIKESPWLVPRVLGTPRGQLLQMGFRRWQNLFLEGTAQHFTTDHVYQVANAEDPLIDAHKLLQKRPDLLTQEMADHFFEDYKKFLDVRAREVAAGNDISPLNNRQIGFWHVCAYKPELVSKEQFNFIASTFPQYDDAIFYLDLLGKNHAAHIPEDLFARAKKNGEKGMVLELFTKFRPNLLKIEDVKAYLSGVNRQYDFTHRSYREIEASKNIVRQILSVRPEFKDSIIKDIAPLSELFEDKKALVAQPDFPNGVDASTLESIYRVLSPWFPEPPSSATLSAEVVAFLAGNQRQ